MDMPEIFAYKIKPHCYSNSVEDVIINAISNTSSQLSPFSGINLETLEKGSAGVCIECYLLGYPREYWSQLYIWGDDSNPYKLLIIKVGLPFPDVVPEEKSPLNYQRKIAPYNSLLSRLDESFEESLKRRHMLL